MIYIISYEMREIIFTTGWDNQWHDCMKKDFTENHACFQKSFHSKLLKVLRTAKTS